MTLLLYAVTDREAGDVDRPGVAGASVASVPYDGLVALSSRHAEVPRPEAAALRAFEDVVEAAADRGAALPFRFGAVMASESEVCELLRERYDEFRRGLECVRGCVEMSVRALADWQPPARTASGTEYMHARLAPVRRARDLQETFAAELEPLARATRYRRFDWPQAPVTAAFLVAREDAERFQVRVTELDGRGAEARLVCSGPWPAYSFTGGEAA
jgi:hypothetical protein